MKRILGACLASVVLSACSAGGSDRVTIYVASDRQIAEPILAAFESETGISVDALFDTEANKTSGLVNRLVAEASRPRADVFWNNEVAQMVRLASAGVLSPLPPLKAEAGSAADATGERMWAGFAARIRVLIVHERAAGADAAPASVTALTDPRWKGQAAVADPHFGSTGAHFAAILTQVGEDGFRSWLRALRANEVAVLAGNAQVKDAVASGRYSFGLTDTDDVNEALRATRPVRLVIPDQGEGAAGALLIPNAVALVRGGPHAANGQKLMSYLLSAAAEAALAQGSGVQMPIRNEVPGPSVLPPRSQIKVLAIDYDAVGRSYERMLQIVDEEWAS